MRIILFDLPQDRIKLFPLTLTKPISQLRVGILKVIEKWERHLPGANISIQTDNYLEQKYGAPTHTEETIRIRANILPSPGLASEVMLLQPGQALWQDDQLVAFYGNSLEQVATLQKVSTSQPISMVERPWHIFRMNANEIRKDFELITAGRKSGRIDDPHTVLYGEGVFVEEGATVKAAVLNAENGPIYIGKGAEVLEGSIIRGPFAMCENSAVSLGGRVKGNVTVGPWSKIGGEISNSVLFDYSNKIHDGYLGSSVIGDWCNLGADTNNSNLKNNYAEVKFWDYESESFISTGEQFCGLVMGDHSKCGINTMFNTGTSVGVSANIYGAGFPRNFIPSFAWGGAAGFKTYRLDKALETIELVKQRRNLSLTDEDKAILTHIFDNFAPGI